MKKFTLAAVIISVILSGCRKPAAEPLSQRIGEMAAFINIVGDRKAFVEKYIDPVHIKILKGQNTLLALTSQLPEQFLTDLKKALETAKTARAVYSEDRKTARFKLKNQPDLNFINRSGEWYLKETVLPSE